MTDNNNNHTRAAIMKISELIHHLDREVIPMRSILPHEDAVVRALCNETESQRDKESTARTEKTKRQTGSSHQREVLESIFRGSPYPNAELRRELAEQFQTTPRKIQIWFQNRRSKAIKKPVQ
ncbi:homeobox protein-like protein [Planoprotostelium fungivorum]|uniref:Homeobox protein-like protein n=1 Tax=Planoprotostelium fungivorum TaxID=1890364 RepID=A0A2P6NQ58_9EUKA|nr:homeobox protein-like protein [Planoprotostelium fungivorum]